MTEMSDVALGLEFTYGSWDLDTPNGTVPGYTAAPETSSNSLTPMEEIQLSLPEDDVATAKNTKGGRPRDLVWSFFTGDLNKMACNYCQWSMERPKAFRMRQHILACPKIPEEERIKIRAAQEHKDKVNAARMASAAGDKSGDNDTIELGLSPSELSSSTPSLPEPSKKRKGESKESKSGSSIKTRAVSAGNQLRSPITCHVLDATSGKPAPGITCRLDRLLPSGFAMLATSQTDTDGRCSTLLPPSGTIEVGIYKITFFTHEYFTMRGVSTFYPFVEITFDIQEETQHYHIPLLLSPYSFSTYRGS